MPEKNAILVGSLNPSIDVTMGVDCLRAGGTNRARFVREDAGGKGVNVARALKAQGVESVRLAGFVWREGGNILENALKQTGVACDFCWLEGATRRNIKILDEEKAEITEVNARSAPVAAEDVHFMREKLLCGAKDAKMVVLTGSLPTDCPADFYAQIIEASPAPCALDADGAALLAGARAKPFLLKCNEKELGVIAQGATALQRVRTAMDQGISIVLASMGAQGSILADASGAWRAAPLQLNVRSTVGAGDAMLSGFLAAYVRGESVREAFRWAVASASASVEGEGTFMPGSAEAARYLPYIQIERLMEW